MGRRKSVKKSHLKLKGDEYLKKVLGDRGESADCAIRAMEWAFDIPYWQAHKFFSKHGRQLRTGTYTSEILGRKSRVIFGHRLGKRISPKKTVRTFLKEHPTGTFFMTVRHHAFAVKDGKALGLSERRYGQHIECYWRVTKIEKNDEKNLVTP